MGPTFKDKDVYIVGKGPSLEYLTEEHFENKDSPVLCINESINVVEKFLDIPNPLFGVRQDDDLRQSCMPLLPTTRMFISPQSQKHYKDVVEQMYVYKYSVFKTLKRHSITAHCAIEIAKFFGAKSFTMLCFDAYHDQTCGYADRVKKLSVKAEKQHSQRRFIKFARDLEDKFLKGTPHTWVRPDFPPGVQKPPPPPKEGGRPVKPRTPKRKRP